MLRIITWPSRAAASLVRRVVRLAVVAALVAAVIVVLDALLSPDGPDRD